MTAFLLIAALMIAAALAFVLVPLLRHSRTATTPADFARRLRALDEARAAGVIDADEYARKHAALGAPSLTGLRGCRPPTDRPEPHLWNVAQCPAGTAG